MRECLNDDVNRCLAEKLIEKAVTHVGQVATRGLTLNLDSFVVDGLAHWGFNATHDIEDHAFKQV